jgi:hypothetical protein
MNNDEQLDNILDEALSAYREAEPLVGIEDRVLQRITAQSETKRRLLWRSIAAVACAAIIILVVSIALRHSGEVPVQHATQRPQIPVTVAKSDDQPSVATQFARAAEPSSPKRSKPRSATAIAAPSAVASATERKPHAVPAPDQFPTPMPLNAEERALLALARTQPEMLLTRSYKEREIEIPLIEIKLLPDPNVGSEGDN